MYPKVLFVLCLFLSRLAENIMSLCHVTCKVLFQRVNNKQSDFRMTLKNGFSKCSLFVLSANGWKDQGKPLWLWRRRCLIGLSCCSVMSKRLYKVLGHEVFSPKRSLNHSNWATRVCIRSINQPNRSISVRLLFCSRVFISKSYKSRSIVTHSLCTVNIVSLWCYRNYECEHITFTRS